MALWAWSPQGQGRLPWQVWPVQGLGWSVNDGLSRARRSTGCRREQAEQDGGGRLQQESDGLQELHATRNRAWQRDRKPREHDKGTESQFKEITENFPKPGDKHPGIRKNKGSQPNTTKIQQRSSNVPSNRLPTERLLKIRDMGWPILNPEGNKQTAKQRWRSQGSWRVPATTVAENPTAKETASCHWVRESSANSKKGQEP